MFNFMVVDLYANPLSGVKITITEIGYAGETVSGVTDVNGKLTLYTSVQIPEVMSIAEVPAGYTCFYCKRDITPWETTTKFIMQDISVPPPPIPTECSGLGFTEVVRCEQVGEYFYAVGWTMSLGIGAEAYPYVMPLYWEADPNEVDVRGGIGSHGGCPSCAMTLVHIRRYIEVVKDCPAYNLLSGEVICMEMDLWKCENGEMVKIEENSPECKEVKPKGPVCPIACVCMGTPLIDQLGPIREFRDEVLKMSRAGLTFVSLYYGKLSPHLSPLLEKSETLRRVGRILVRGLLRMMRK